MIDINKVEVPNLKTKQVIGIVKQIKELVELGRITNNCSSVDVPKISEVLKGFFQNGEIMPLLDLILDDYDSETKDYGKLGKMIFRIISDISNLNQNDVEELDLSELDILIRKIFNKLKEVQFVNNFLSKIMITQTMTKELNTIENIETEVEMDTLSEDMTG